MVTGSDTFSLSVYKKEIMYGQLGVFAKYNTNRVRKDPGIKVFYLSLQNLIENRMYFESELSNYGICFFVLIQN